VSVPTRPRTDEPIFHLALPDDWARAFDTGDYRISTRGSSLDEVGFIHCSTRAQIVPTANRFYADLFHLVVLTIDPLLVPVPVVFEPPAPGSPELFPHIYGPLPIAAVDMASPWLRAPDAPWSLDTP
jgi:uncharacterized protein (DUF952 family)